MNDNRYIFAENVRPLISPVDTAATAVATPFVALANALHATFFVYFGTITAASADQAVIVTLEAATTGASGSEAAIAFTYRLSGIHTANTWGAATAATSSGVSIGTTDDDKMLAIDINPAGLETLKADTTHVRVVITPDAGGSATEVAAWAVIKPRYPQVTHVSAT